MPQNSPSRKKILFLSRECPYPLPGDYRLRTARLIELLLEKQDVELLCFRNPRGEATIPPELLPKGLQISWIEPKKESLWNQLSLALKPQAIASYSSAMKQALEMRASPDAILWVCRMEMGQYIPLACELGFRVVFDEQSAISSDLFRKGFSSWQEVPSLLQGAHYRIFEKSYCERARAVIGATPLDAARLQKLAPLASVHFIPDGIDSANFAALRSSTGEDIAFTGALNTPASQEGLRWFAVEVIPRLRAALGHRLPRLVAAGPRPSNEAFQEEMARAGIEIVEDPDSFIPILHSAAVVIFPFRKETDEARIRILEAMAAGRALVSTPKAVEGLTLSPSYDIWVAEAPDGFTTAILRLLDNADLRQKTANRAVDTIEKLYDWGCVRQRLDSLLASLVSEPL